MDAIHAINTRRSIRHFGHNAVSEDIIKDIVNCGRLAATARNMQPWEFVVITDREMKYKISQLATTGPFIDDAPVCIAVLCHDVKYYLEDGCAATQNILVAARAHGLGSCWVAGDKKPYAKTIVKLFKAPDNMKLVSLIAIGEAQYTPKPDKRSLDRVLHWGHY